VRRRAASRAVVDDYGTRVRVRWCPSCLRWLPETYEMFSIRRRHEDGTVRTWDGFCRTCRAAQRRERYAAKSVEERREDARRRWDAVKADPEKMAARRAKNAEAQREYRRKHPEKTRRQHREWMARMRKDPVRYRAYLERCRINYRLRAEREGRELARAGVTRFKVEHPTFVPGAIRKLPAAPLARVVKSAARRQQRTVEEMAIFCGVSLRTVEAWEDERELVQFNAADGVLVALGLLWFDVWDCERHGEHRDGCEGCEARRAAEVVWEPEEDFMGCAA
jgi:hypothetical protein